MAFQVHRVMKYAADDHNSIVNAVNQEMSGFMNGIACDMSPALTKMPRVHPFSEFGPGLSTGAVRILGDVADTCGNQRGISLLRLFAEMGSGPSKDRVDIIGGCMGDSVLGHQTDASAPSRPKLEMYESRSASSTSVYRPADTSSHPI